MLNDDIHPLQIFDKASPITVLGPGNRAVIWLQGCLARCPGCLVPESHALDGGKTVEVADLAIWILEQSDIDGVTFSGGEPFLQALGLARLIGLLRREREIGVMCYTGYTLEALKTEKAPEGAADLLDQVDLLVDGPYMETKHGDLLWRGSINQKLRFLTSRYRYIENWLGTERDRSAGVLLRMMEEETFQFVGVPSVVGFRETFESELMARGVLLASGRNNR